MLETRALREGLWRFTPVAVMNSCVRGFLLGLEVSLFIGMPTLLFIWANVGDGEAPGFSWCIFKGIWAAFVAMPVFVVVFLSAIDKRRFKAELEFEQLISVAAAYNGVSRSIHDWLHVVLGLFLVMKEYIFLLLSYCSILQHLPAVREMRQHLLTLRLLACKSMVL